MLDEHQIRRLDEIQQRVGMTAGGIWRNRIRRENGKEMIDAILKHGGPGIPLCSQSVVNTESTPTEKNVICWMGPAAGEQGDDLLDATFIANAKADIQWLLELVNSIATQPSQRSQ